MIRTLRRTGIVLAGLYIAYGALMVWAHPMIIYPFVDDPFDAPGFEARPVVVPGADPVTVHVHQGRRDRAVVVYFMGNLGALDLFRPMLDHHVSKGRSVVAMTYRGGGGEAGKPTETALKRDARAVMAALPDLVEARQVVVQGFSLGTGLAIHAAANADVDGVVLSAPYDRLCRLMAQASGLPACYMPVQGWKSTRDIDAIPGPVLIVHGTADQVIPLSYGKRLGDAMVGQGISVTFRDIEGGGHNNLTRFRDYLATLDRFVDGL